MEKRKELLNQFYLEGQAWALCGGGYEDVW